MTTVTDRFRVKIGGCYFINCRDLIVAHGESLFRIHRRDDDGILLVDFDIYDAKGAKLATVRNGSIVEVLRGWGHDGLQDDHHDIPVATG